MRRHFTGVAIAALFTFSATLPGRTEDAKTPPAARQTEPPVSVPRPSIAPKTAEPASAPVANDAAPRRHRRYAYRYYRHYAYWEPFPVFLPHFYRHRIYWNRISWFAF
jgi:hypothetical protein